MLNTKSTIPENWLFPAKAEALHKPVYHFALKQNKIGLDLHLSSFFKKNNVSVHNFDTFDDLVTLCQRFPIDLTIIGGVETFIKEVELVRALKRNVLLSPIPIILFHPNPDENIVIAAYQNGAEDFIYGDWREKLIEVRIQKIVERNRRDMAINPSTHLPGPTIIEGEINRMLKMKSDFAICYADLDNFKAYNDYYGYYSGDQVIRLTARVLKDVVFEMCREAFLGHIAGDDFIFVIPPNEIDRMCRQVLDTFDSLIPYRYEEIDRQRGYITTVNRGGEIEDFQILTMSIAVLVNEDGKFGHLGEMSHMLADLKKATKKLQGSNYMVERRNKY